MTKLIPTLTLFLMLFAPSIIIEAAPRVIRQKTLPVVYSNQQYTLSCEAASLEMAMRYKGHNISEDDILNKLGVSNPYTKRYEGGRMIWGDPDQAFVGNVRGSISGSLSNWTGWGVNQTPVGNIAKQYNQYAYGKSNGSLLDLRNEIDNGNPIVIWLQYDERLSKGEQIYYTPEGKRVRMIANHVVLVYGYQIMSDNSTRYFIHDPWDRAGSNWRVKYGKLTGNLLYRYWSRYNFDMVVAK